jgi:putative nucleotidyltransferase with HDIG domain
MSLNELIPSPPDWRLDWQAFDDRFEWIRAMQGCPQSPIHHAEGEVWIHVRMVCESLAAMPEWRALAEPDRALVFTAALLHDVAKPVCTRTEEGRITSRGHSARGAHMARRILWELAVDVPEREQVCAMVRYHQYPYYLIERSDAVRSVLRMSQTARCDLLAMLARADVLGRICQDQQNLLTKIDLFAELAREQSCLIEPWHFPSPLSRFEYFRSETRDPHYQAHDSFTSETILMSGLPGSGKDSWIKAHAANLPMISLDEIREEIGAPPAGNQGEVIHLAKDRARAFLRQNKDFVWNATNLTHEHRSQLVDLFTGYQARARIVHVEAPYSAIFDRNRQRHRVVPEEALNQMIDRWEIPNPAEAPVVEWWTNADSWQKRL